MFHAAGLRRVREIRRAVGSLTGTRAEKALHAPSGIPRPDSPAPAVAPVAKRCTTGNGTPPGHRTGRLPNRDRS